jgi:hypothetical protein
VAIADEGLSLADRLNIHSATVAIVKLLVIASGRSVLLSRKANIL